MTAHPSPIVLGCRVTVELVAVNGEVDRRELVLVRARQADFKAGLLGENAPLGRALLGRHAGETIPYRFGDLKEVRILSAEAETGATSSEVADQRRAAVQEAANQSEIVNQMIFATARGSKWGDYEVDVEKLMPKKSSSS